MRLWKKGLLGKTCIVSGIDFRRLPEGTRFRCGEVVLELSPDRKRMSQRLRDIQTDGRMHHAEGRGICRGSHGGTIREGDELTVI